MKKVSIFLILFILSVTSSFSQNSFEKQVVLNSLKSFDVTIHKSELNTDGKKKWWQTVLNICTVVVADCGGAYAGVQGTMGLAGVVGLATGGTGVAVVAGVAGVIGAAGASNGAYQGLNKQMPSSPNFGTLNIQIPREYTYFTNLGFEHNNVLFDNFVLGKPLNTFYSSKLNESEIKLIESDEMQQKFRFMNELGLTYTQKVQNIDFFLSQLVQEKLMTLTGKEILNTFFEKFQTSASPKDMEDFINFSISTVASSQLEEKEKLPLLAAFIVSSQSPFFTITNSN